jgi:hypothetical protein
LSLTWAGMFQMRVERRSPVVSSSRDGQSTCKLYGREYYTHKIIHGKATQYGIEANEQLHESELRQLKLADDDASSKRLRQLGMMD